MFLSLPMNVPDIRPEVPPGMEPIVTLLNWGAQFVLWTAIAVFLGSLGVLVVGALQGREIAGMKGLIISLIVCVVVGGVSAIIRVFT